MNSRFAQTEKCASSSLNEKRLLTVFSSLTQQGEPKIDKFQLVDFLFVP